MAIQDNTTQDHPVVAATRARQGRWGKHVLWVLIVSTVLAALVLMGTWGANANRLGAVEGNQRAVRAHQPDQCGQIRELHRHRPGGFEPHQLRRRAQRDFRQH